MYNQITKMMRLFSTMESENVIPYIFLLFIIANSSFAATVNQWPYVGITSGAAFAKFAGNTVITGPLDPAQANSINTTGNQILRPTGFITGIEAGYNWQFNKILFSLESDLQALSLNDSINSGAIPLPNVSNTQFVMSSYANTNWLITLRPRLGLVSHQLLFYTTGGLVLTPLQADFVFSDNRGSFASSRVSQLKAGFVVGAGIETLLTPIISLKAEYLFVDVNRQNASTMSRIISGSEVFDSTTNFKTNIFRLGLNASLNNNSFIPFNENFLPCFLNRWQIELGARNFISTGTIGAPLPLLNYPGNMLASRLIYSKLFAITGETFGRVDHPSGVFVKGFLGAGSITHGQLNDEDFPAGGSYSNTFSKARGNIAYANVDIGYSVLRNSIAKADAFIGYNYYTQNINIYACHQYAGSGVCAPPVNLQNFLGISEEDWFNSLRIGFSSSVQLTPQLRLVGEAAYLPLVYFNGQDDHNARELIGPEHSHRGNGVMLESRFNYQLDCAWAIGLGLRYWAWNMHKGFVIFDFLGDPDTLSEPARFNSVRYGSFLEINYKNNPFNNTIFTTSDLSWRGLFLGAHLGGAWNNILWSDPFAATLSTTGRTNIAGFGDKIHATGPLGGANINLNWQTNQLVYGITATLNWADVRGENTLFSGLGGINGEAYLQSLGTLVIKLGTTFNRALLYLNGGWAALETKYHLNANTSILSLGSQSTIQTNNGWTIGVGIDYAITDHWFTNFEYDYIKNPSHVVHFSHVTIINTQTIRISQNLNLFKVGLSYKFNCN